MRLRTGPPRTTRTHLASVTIWREALTSDGEHDGVHWEFSIDWIDLSGRAVPQLDMFDDAWVAFNEVDMIPFFEMLAEWNDKNVTPEEVTTFLASSGFTDTTDRVKS